VLRAGGSTASSALRGSWQRESAGTWARLEVGVGGGGERFSGICRFGSRAWCPNFFQQEEPF
jgi:hypothetical protein